jgi:hypothetical protein
MFNDGSDLSPALSENAATWSKETREAWARVDALLRQIEAIPCRPALPAGPSEAAIEAARRAMVKWDAEDTMQWLTRKDRSWRLTDEQARAMIGEAIQDLGGSTGTREMVRTMLCAYLAAERSTPEGRGSVTNALTEEQAEMVEQEMRRLESDPQASKAALRLFMQHPMPCGHAAGNLLTCDRPPFGCVICNAERSRPVGPEL